jgi:(S)-citramalyl-CoA lyase
MAISNNHSTARNPRRSLLFVPGTRLEILPKALASSTDIICIDLEDAVADDQKYSVREKVISIVATTKSSKANPEKEIWVRINSIRTTSGLADILALAQADKAPNGIMIPKINSPEEIHILRDILSEKHKELIFHPLIETTKGLKWSYEIAKSSHKIGSILLGGFDMSANLRTEPNWNALLFSRQQLVLAAANAKVDLLDMPYFGVDNPEGLRQESQKVLEIGYTGKCAIHPKQIDIINQIFSPTLDEIDRAKNLIKKYEAQDEAFVEIDGVLMEKPIVERLYRVIAIGERIKSR